MQICQFYDESLHDHEFRSFTFDSFFAIFGRNFTNFFFFLPLRTFHSDSENLENDEHFNPSLPEKQTLKAIDFLSLHGWVHFKLVWFFITLQIAPEMIPQDSFCVVSSYLLFSCKSGLEIWVRFNYTECEITTKWFRLFVLWSDSAPDSRWQQSGSLKDWTNQKTSQKGFP